MARALGRRLRRSGCSWCPVSERKKVFHHFFVCADVRRNSPSSSSSSAEKKVALLKELDRLRGERSEELESCPSEELRPCHGSVTISDIQLPLKVDYVCKAIRDSGTCEVRWHTTT